MNIFLIAVLAVFMPHLSMCQNDDTDEIPWPEPNAGGNSPESPKNLASLYADQLDDDDIDFVQLVRSPITVDQALQTEEYDRRFLLITALEHDRISTIRHLITPPLLDFDKWPSAEINWLKTETIICRSSRSSAALNILLSAGFDCSSGDLWDAIDREDAKSFRLLLPIISRRFNDLSYPYLPKLWSAAAGNFGVEALKFLNADKNFQMDMNSFKQVCRVAASNGNLEVLGWLDSLEACGVEIYDYAIENDRMNVIKWARNKKIGGEIADIKWGQLAASRGLLEQLKNAKRDGAEFDENVCISAASAGHLEILQWAKEEGLSCASSAIIFHAKMNGHENVVEWASDIPPTLTKAFCKLANAKGALSVLQWYFERGVSCAWVDTLNGSFRNNHVHVLEWAWNNGVKFNPTRNDLDDAARLGSLNSIKWAHSRGIDLRSFILSWTNRGYYDAVQWFYHELPDADRYYLVNLIFKATARPRIPHASSVPGQKTDQKAMLEWLVGLGFAITEKTLNEVIFGDFNPVLMRMILEMDISAAVGEIVASHLAFNGKLQMLKMAAKKGMKLSIYACKGAAYRNHFATTKWLIKQEGQKGGDLCLKEIKMRCGIIKTWVDLKYPSPKPTEEIPNDLCAIQ